MRSIKFLSFYNTPDNPEKHKISPAGENKTGYVIHAISELKIPLEVITASRSETQKSTPRITKQLNEYAKLILPADPKAAGKIGRLVFALVYRIGYIGYLMKRLRRNDVLIVYHSLRYMNLVERLKKLIGFKLVLEVEEIYGDVQENNETVAKEMQYFQCADAYIFPTESLNRKINTTDKPYVIAHGTYRVEVPRNVRVFSSANQNFIHCVYAGTFDPCKGGVFAALEAAQFLPENYHVHIIGFGTADEIRQVEERIREIAPRCKAGLSYDGCLSGEDYIQFIQSCDIGLSTQNPAAAYNNTSFPSKILSYMANGVRVVSIRIPVVEESSVGDMICYYDEQTPESIANAILHVDLNNVLNSRARIQELDRRCQQELKVLFCKLGISK